MTSNQIAYWRVQEEQRSHQVSESLTAQDLAEKKRSNIENERLKQFQNDETVRHNFAIEELDRIKNELAERGLDIKSNEVLMDLAELYAKYGEDALAYIPDSLGRQLNKAITGKETTTATGGQGVWEMLKAVGNGWKNFWSIGKAGAALF